MTKKLIQIAVLFALTAACSFAVYAVQAPSTSPTGFPTPSNCPPPCWSGAELVEYTGTCTKTNSDGCTHRCKVYLTDSGQSCYNPNQCYIL